jgi:diguanylate cyclase (GGDEF)-like protein
LSTFSAEDRASAGTTMNLSRIRVLHVEDNPGDARLMQVYLAESEVARFDVTRVLRVAEAERQLEVATFDVVLLDLSLPDGQGLETVRRLCSAAPDLPIVVLTGLEDETMGLRAVQAGAQDYLVKNRLDALLCARALRYAIERHRTRRELLSLSLMDEMTGLYNRRGFLALAEQQFRQANRQHCGLVLLFCDVDHLKEINDGYGHAEGDQALMVTARLLRETLRETDLVARIGGDEFTVLALDTSGEGAAGIVARLRERFELHNRHSDRPYAVSVSLGVARRDARSCASVEVLLADADRALYEQKRARPAPRAVRSHDVKAGARGNLA